VLRVKLRRIDAFNEARRANAERYRKSIKRDDVILPVETEGCRNVYHQFTIRSKKRDIIMKALADNDISSAVYYPVPLHHQEAFARWKTDAEGLLNSEVCAAEVLSLPMFPELKEEEILRISDVINHAF
jgi:dTDP-4-amino-4,6-dideoxygalactose transaminase